jgi:hypothetical protein
VLARVRLVLGADPVRERVVIVGSDLGVAPDLQVAVRDREVQDQQARGRVGLEVLRLLPRVVPRVANSPSSRSRWDEGIAGMVLLLSG